MGEKGEDYTLDLDRFIGKATSSINFFLEKFRDPKCGKIVHPGTGTSFAPAACNNCHKIFCYACTSDITKDKTIPCPSLDCKDKATKFINVPSQIKNILDGFQVSCKNKGCNSIYLLKVEAKHLSICPFKSETGKGPRNAGKKGKITVKANLNYKGKPMTIKCPKEHILVRVKDIEEFECDDCGEDGYGDNGCLFCKPCNFTLCSNCEKKIIQQNGASDCNNPSGSNKEDTSEENKLGLKCNNEHELERVYENRNYNCSKCPRKFINCFEEGSLYCTKCNYNLCIDCEKKEQDKADGKKEINVKDIGLKCKLNHPLKKVYEVYPFNLYKCSVCNKKDLNALDEGTFYCNECEYFLCPDCEKNENDQLKAEEDKSKAAKKIEYDEDDDNLYCENDHVLELTYNVYTYNDFICNLCREDKNCEDEGVYHCSECNYDICPSCAEKELNERQGDENSDAAGEGEDDDEEQANIKKKSEISKNILIYCDEGHLMDKVTQQTDFKYKCNSCEEGEQDKQVNSGEILLNCCRYECDSYLCPSCIQIAVEDLYNENNYSIDYDDNDELDYGNPSRTDKYCESGHLMVMLSNLKDYTDQDSEKYRKNLYTCSFEGCGKEFNSTKKVCLHCDICLFDICEEHEKVYVGAEVKSLSCINHHYMVKTKNLKNLTNRSDNDYVCNFCRRQYQSDQNGVYYCNDCSFGICFTCYDERFQNSSDCNEYFKIELTCDRGHYLVKVNNLKGYTQHQVEPYLSNRYDCNQCHKRLNMDYKEVWHCDTCKYDLCPSCAAAKYLNEEEIAHDEEKEDNDDLQKKVLKAHDNIVVSWAPESQKKAKIDNSKLRMDNAKPMMINYNDFINSTPQDNSMEEEKSRDNNYSSINLLGGNKEIKGDNLDLSSMDDVKLDINLGRNGVEIGGKDESIVDEDLSIDIYVDQSNNPRQTEEYKKIN